MDRSRYLVPLLALLLMLPMGTALAQDGDSDLQSEAEALAENLNDLADAIDPFSPADGDAVASGDIDPTDPDAPVDPDSPSEGDDVEPGAIDPSDPQSMPGDPEVPAEPVEPGSADEPGGIELPEPSEPEEGGFKEIQLLPDPPPRPGGWTVVNHPGRMTCTGVGSIDLKRSRQTTRLKVLEDGRVLRGPKLAPKAGNIRMTWQPESEAYTGVVRVAAPGGRTQIKFELRVVNPNKMQGEMVATVNVKDGDINSSCTGSRKITLTHD